MNPQPPDHDHAGHDHAGHHHHGHSHAGHSHAPAEFGRAFAIGIALNTGFVVVEAFYGWAANSMALIADAGHNLSDVLGLIVAWVAAVLARRLPSTRYTYGFKASSVLAALFNAVFLLVAAGAIAWEAVLRLIKPEAVASITVMVVAAVGIAINGITAWLFASGAKGDLNIRGAYLHMIADAAVSAGVVLAGAAILATGWIWLDPVVSLVVIAVIVWSTWGLLRDSLTLSLAAVPPGIDPVAVRTLIAGQPGVESLHDLHIWAMGTTEIALTAHLVMPSGHPGDAALLAIASELSEHHGIAHVTLQVETDAATACPLKPEDVV